MKEKGVFSGERAAVCILGAGLGGFLFEQGAKILIDPSLQYRYHFISDNLTWMVGATICGLVIPTEINRRVDHLTLKEAYKRMFTFDKFEG